jgi:hypothetical protein
MNALLSYSYVFGNIPSLSLIFFANFFYFYFYFTHILIGMIVRFKFISLGILILVQLFVENVWQNPRKRKITAGAAILLLGRTCMTEGDVRVTIPVRNCCSGSWSSSNLVLMASIESWYDTIVLLSNVMEINVQWSPGMSICTFIYAFSKSCILCVVDRVRKCCGTHVRWYVDSRRNSPQTIISRLLQC